MVGCNIERWHTEHREVSFLEVILNFYADIILPLAQPTYTFAVAEGMTVSEGQAVVVQFGHSKIYTGIVWRVHTHRPDFKTIKTISRILYGEPLLSAEHRHFWEWLADYYMCSLGEVMRMALPALMKPCGDTEEAFAEDEFRPRTERYVALAEQLRDQAQLHAVLDKLEKKAPKQYAALLELAAAAAEHTHTAMGEVAQRLLSADRTVLNGLKNKDFITITERERSVESPQHIAFRLPVLTARQQEVAESLRRQFENRQTILLHGITGSGKTEIYIHLIADVLARGGDVLMLVPEIALTAQLIERMERIFGSRVTSYHSKLSTHKRTETYLRLSRSAGGEFVVGARSALFLPLKHLQLLVVDEEHDASYKQTEPAPRYHARDCAVIMARIFGAHTVLGSATPSLESWLNAQSGKYGREVLEERYGAARPPQIIVSDTLRAVKRGERHTHFNKILLDKIENALARKEQVMLFQNRRGFSPYVECRTCGWTARCPHCNVTLALHKNAGKLICHYCGYSTPIPAKCPSCKVTEVVPMGFGTEKVEEEISAIFPQARVARLDRDCVTSEKAFSAIVSAFEQGQTDILVGTQMITKGFDFGGVSLVGILNADNLLNNPDFRATERAFQLMTQVAGRAGRRNDGGEVIIQTTEPENPIIRQVTGGEYEAMAREQLAERAQFFYPPYARLIALTLRHRDPLLLRRCAQLLATNLRAKFGRRLLGPMAPPVDKIREEYLIGLLLKIESGSSMAKAREILKKELDEIHQDTSYKSVTIICNVDPQ